MAMPVPFICARSFWSSSMEPASRPYLRELSLPRFGIDALIAEFGAGKGIESPREPRTLFVVGDVKQSIYSFQGADVAAFDRMRDHFGSRLAGGSGLNDSVLEHSFRSSPAILDVVDERLAVELAADRPGLLGTAIIAGHATEVIDAGYWLRQAFDDWFEKKGMGEQKHVQPRLLVVEDSQFFRELLAPLLTASGFAVTLTENPNQA
ncbi:MAG: UvrD-helicase domain-containing protein, partial [Akkermansiaceae bacterium]|nr:UvrD-helicase domain-containing protein [Akkermansiaceae bacterium]